MLPLTRFLDTPPVQMRMQSSRFAGGLGLTSISCVLNQIVPDHADQIPLASLQVRPSYYRRNSDGVRCVRPSTCLSSLMSV